MEFTSFEFLFFFPLVVSVYYLIPKRYSKIWILFSSYFFYFSWNPKGIFILLSITLLSYSSGLFLEKNVDNRIKKKTIIVFSIVIELIVLTYFKYFNYFINILSSVISWLGIKLIIPKSDIILPIGISFYVFQSIGYLVDIYRGKIKAEKKIIDFAIFVAFFPQLLAGPIARAKNLINQFSKDNKFNYQNYQYGIIWILYGLFLKLVIADRALVFVDSIYQNLDVFNGLYYLSATFIFAIQIYCDFYGYSLIARGTAKMLNIDLANNFNTPYLSSSISEFWRRWHISLSTWFRDYLYIPLGGNRDGKIKKYINIIIVFLISGLWHGASTNYVIWGLLNGLYQVIGDIIRPIKNKLLPKNKNTKPCKIIVTFSLVCTTWIFFKANNLNDCIYIIKEIFNIKNYCFTENGYLALCGLDIYNFVLLMICSLFVLFIDILKYNEVKLDQIILEKNIYIRCAFLSLSIFFISLFGVWGPTYNISSFIYFNF